MFCAPQAAQKTQNQVLVQKILYNNVYRNVKISGIVSDSGSDSRSFSDHSDGDTCTMEYILITKNKKFIFDNHTHERVTQVISAGLLEFATVIHIPHAVSV
jgi:glutamine phosphoribosylpyrophosphate amidotransferase